MKRLSVLTERLTWRKTEAPDPEASGKDFGALRILLGESMIAAGAASTVDALTGRNRAVDDHPSDGLEIYSGRRDSPPRGVSWLRVVDWLPLALGPAAGAAQIAHAIRPNGGSRAAATILCAAALAAGGAALAESFRATVAGERPPSLPHIVFSSLSLLGIVVDRTERLAAERSVVRVPVTPRPEVRKIVIRA